MAATILNPNAPLFLPTAAELLHPPPPPPHPFPPFIPQRFDHSSKGAIFFHPSLFYYHPLFPNFSYYIPPPKYSISTAGEMAGALPPLPEEQSSPVEAKIKEEQSMRTVSCPRFALRGFRGRYGNRHLIRRSPQLWVRKSVSKEDNFSLPDDFQFGRGVESTVMIKNIPNKLSRVQVLELLDRHCLSENQKIKEDDLDIVFSEFDFLYLPMDFISGNNLGYAFVNFTSSAAANRLYKDMHMMNWNSFGSRKICEITHAKIQGLEELVKHFRRSLFTCSSADYLPVYFKPSRDGYRDSDGQLVGKLVQRSLC